MALESPSIRRYARCTYSGKARNEGNSLEPGGAAETRVEINDTTPKFQT